MIYLPGNNTRSFGTNTESLLAVQWTFAVDGVTQSIDYTTKESITDWDVDDSSGTLDDITFLDVPIVTEDYNTDVVGFQVQGHALETRAEFHHLIGLDVLQTINTGNTVTNAEYTSSFFQIGLELFEC